MGMKLAAWGKVAGGLSLLVLLSAPYTLFVSTGSTPMTLAKVGVGLSLLALYLGTNWRTFGQFASRKSTAYVGMTAVTGLFLLGGLGAVNWVAWKKNVRWDLTDKQIHSLHEQTLTVLGELPLPVQAIAFLGPEQPEYELLDHQLARYAREGKGRFSYVFRDPRKYPDLTQKYGLREGRPTVVLTRGEGEQESHVSVHRFGENDLTQALLKLQTTGEQKVYFTVGHDEWPLQLEPGFGQPGGTLSQLLGSLHREGYQTDTLSLAGGEDVPKDAAIVVVAGARNRFSENEEASIERYLEAGGRLLVFADALIDGGLERVLSKHGISLDEGIVADNRFAVQSPYALVSVFYGDHPISERHGRAQLQTNFLTTRGLSIVREGILPDVDAKPLVLSSPYAWVETNPGPAPQLDDGEKAGQIPLAVASERSIDASREGRRFDKARVVVFGDSELLLDVNWGVENNRNLVLNAFGWVTEQAAKVSIRPRDRDVSTLELDGDMLTRIHFTATDLLPLLLLGIGVAIWQTRRNK